MGVPMFVQWEEVATWQPSLFRFTIVMVNFPRCLLDGETWWLINDYTQNKPHRLLESHFLCWQTSCNFCNYPPAGGALLNLKRYKVSTATCNPERHLKAPRSPSACSPHFPSFYIPSSGIYSVYFQAFTQIKHKLSLPGWAWGERL